ncbi:SMP-30/gluconolactonase/LRE family protein, partial [Corallococcus exiguus]|nr:SMP-30/gluconolactonase/LRE family protein [Corallococcus exiguus]
MSSPAVHPHVPHVAVSSACVLGEGVLWDHRTETVYWVDIRSPAVWHYQPRTKQHG